MTLMSLKSREKAEKIICQRGWLSHMPVDFRTLLLHNAEFLRFRAGTVIFSPGDPAGGIYGLVSGVVTVKTAPSGQTPRLIHIAVPGGWTGEDSFLTGDPRRISLTAYTDIQVMHVPLPVMEEMACTDPNTLRAFSSMSLMSTDSLIRIIHDLQIKDVSSRIASALHRMSWSTDTPVMVSQENLSIITNTSRKQVNIAVQRFEEKGWIEASYRAITVINPDALLQFAERRT